MSTSCECNCRPAIVQGGNNPLVVQFDAEVEQLPTLVITLWRDKPGSKTELLHQWNKENMYVTGRTAICPIEEEETGAYTASTVMLEAKGLDGEGNTVFWDEYQLDIKHRRDRVIVLTQSGA